MSEGIVREKDVYSSLSDASKVRELLKDVYSSLSLASKVRELLKGCL